MDQADIADLITAEYLEKAIAAARGIELKGTGKSSTHCIDCGDRIPEKRRDAVTGCMRCISCAEDHEKRRHPSCRMVTTAENNEGIIDDILLAESIQ